MGGYGNGTKLWQAGILIEARAPDNVSLLPWNEAWPDQPSFNLLPADALGTVHLGDVINVSVSYERTNNSVSSRICDVTNEICYSSPNYPNFTPDMTTAEWVVEDPQVTSVCVVNCFITPWFTDISFSSPWYFDASSGDHSGFTLPILRLVGEGGSYSDSWNRTITQWEIPGPLEYRTPDEFRITYSPTCDCS